MTRKSLAPQQIPESGQRSLVFHDGETIVIFNVDGQLYAIKNECPHAGAALCSGRLTGHLIQCPAHGLRFDVRTGAMSSNAELRVQVYPILKHDDEYVLELGTDSTSVSSNATHIN